MATKYLALIMVMAVFLTGATECGDRAASTSGVNKASVVIRPGADGFTTEQRNVRDRLLEDNKPGSIKHLYVVSAYSGQVIMYSTVRGKVTSGGKRLTPIQVSTASSASGNFRVQFPDGTAYTNEVLQDDGTYGSSVEYLYWWDTKGLYHQHYVSGGQIVHVASQPIAVKGVVINLETGRQ